jgi:hypothetical protein
MTIKTVAHYGEQNGDAMRDPEMVFEVSPDLGVWTPTYFLNDYAGVEQNVFKRVDGNMTWKPALKRGLDDFAKTWDRNIKEQGFLEAYRKVKTALLSSD